MTDDRASEGTFQCPNCREVLSLGVERCGACGLRLTGPQATRLWQVDTSLRALFAERGELIEALLAPAPADVAFPSAAHQGAPTMRAPRERARLSGQQILLGLGALLLLSGAAAFLALAWATLGVVGQTVVMGGVTVAVAVATRWPSARGLAAAAETGAVITGGLLALDLWAARHLGVAGLGQVDAWWYAAAASALAGGLLVLADAAQPREGRGDRRRYRVFAFRLLAGVAVTVAPWCVVAAVAPTGAALVAAFLLVALVNAGCAVVAVQLDGVTAAHRLDLLAGYAASAFAPLLGAALGLLAYVAAGLRDGYAPYGVAGDHYAAAALLAIAPVVAAVAAARVAGRPALRAQLVVLALVGAAGVAGIPLLDVGRVVWLVLAVVATLAVVALNASGVGGQTPGRRAVRNAVVALLMTLAAPAAYVAVTAITRLHVGTLRDALGSHAATIPPVTRDGVLLMVAPALAAVIVTVSAGLRHRTPAWVVAVQAAVAVTAATAIQAAPSMVWTVVGTIMAVLLLVVAFLAARSSKDTGLVRFLDRSSVLFATAYAFVALAATVDAPSPARAAIVLIPVGVAVLLYAAAPRRLGFAYVGSALVSGGVDCLLADRTVSTVEAYTLPLAVLLAAVGWVQWSRDRDLPTRLTMGPALGVAVMPSLLATLSGDSVVRLALVTVAGIALVLAGLSRRWQAPVGVGVVALVVLALTQGGPLLGYVPPWVTLATAGALVLAFGVRWEETVATGKRAGVWYQSLR